MVFELFSDKLQKLIKKKGFIEPTLPQKMGIPEIVSGRNVLIIAPTGIGKTEAAMLPLFDKISKEKDIPISILYISPLRSLNRDLLDRLCWWADKLDLDISVRHGDTSQQERAAQRVMPSNILITTPETLQAILPGKIMRKHLANVKHVVIDEIHELIDSKRGTQLSIALERLREVAGEFQRIGLSATVGSPKIVAEFLGENVKVVKADAEKKYEIRVESPGPVKKDKMISEDLFIKPEITARLRRLYELIQSHKSVLAFTNTRETAEVLSSRLRSLDRELKQTVHHGSLSKEIRIKSEQEFKNELLKSLIATSSLELGIDIGSIDLVVQYLSPRQVSRIIQRVGRSGHKVTETSKGIIISGEEDLFESTVIADRAIKKLLERVKIHEQAFDVLSTQIVGLALDEYDMPESRIYRVVKRAYPFRKLDKKDLTGLLEFMESLRLVWLNKTSGEYMVRRRKKSWEYYFSNLSTIPDTSQFRVISIIENEPIGMLDEEFVAEHGQPGNRFVCSGRAWRIIQVDGNKVIVEPVEDIESAIPAWEGELIPVPFEIAQDVGKLRRRLSNNQKIEYNIDANSLKTMKKIIDKQKETNTVPDNRRFLIENYKDFVIIHSCCGSLVNDTIGKYVATALTEKTGVSVNMKTDPYRIMLQTTAKPEAVKTILEDSGNFEDVIMGSLERSSLFKWRFVHIAKKFGIIARSARYDKINLNRIISNYEGSPAYKEVIREILLDKMDIKNSKQVLESIRKKGIKLKVEKGLSILGENGLVQQFSEVMKPRMPEKEIFNAFRKRLLTTRIRLLCVNCGEYNIVRTVRDIEDQPECPKCGSRLIAAVRKYKTNANDIVKKRLKKREMTKDELEQFNNIRRSADLVIVYGKKAVIALAGRGIGPQTAARILAMLHHKREEFFKDILKAEKDFARTKKYWK